jgi:LAGLIDADG DNA endonuclease family
MTHTSVTPYFVFTQTIKKLDYVWHVFTTLGHYCSKLPRLQFSVRAETVVGTMQVITRSFPIMLKLYNLFYTRINGKVVKGITLDLLNYLDPIVLAYWAMMMVLLLQS